MSMKNRIKTVTKEEVLALSTADLVLFYNEVTGSKIKKFSDRATGVKRTLAALEEAQATEKHPTKEQIEAEEAGQKPVVSKAKNALPTSHKRFNLPAHSTIAPHREGTARAKAIAALTKGATFQEVQAATGWTKHRAAYEGIRLLHTHLGYGLKEDDNGVIQLVTKK